MLLLTFLAFTALVAVASWFFSRRADHGTSTGYFLAGRSLSPMIIAGSLLLTNLSTEQLVGLNGGAYKEGMIGMAWEVFAALAMVLMALFLLPRYLARGIATVPEFLEWRYDRPTRALTSCVFLLSITMVTMPFVLYSGALFLRDAFDVPAMLDISKDQALWVMIIAIGVVAGAYAVFGGLRAVAVSDTINGIGLLAGGVALPILGLQRLGDGNFSAGVHRLLTENPERLDPVGASTSDLPWTTLFTGVMLLHMAYWCTNQYIVQRTFAAKSLAAGQKGLLIAATLKLLGPFYLVLPGVIAWHLSKGGLEKPDESYAWLMKELIHTPLFLGLFCAVIFGAILSTLNSAINSAATLFSLDLYKGLWRPAATDRDLVRAGKIFGCILGVAAILLAPVMANAQGLFQLMKNLSATFDIPLLSIVLAGMLTRRAPAAAAKVALGTGIVFYAIAGVFMFQWFGIFDHNVTGINIPQLHVAGVNFVLCMGILLGWGKLWPATLSAPSGPAAAAGGLDLTPWPMARPLGISVLVAMAAVYAAFMIASR